MHMYFANNLMHAVTVVFPRFHKCNLEFNIIVSRGKHERVSHLELRMNINKDCFWK